MIAMLTMLIDHVGVIFFPSDELWRIIGRLAFPLYAYFIAQGYRYTSDLKLYGGRLLALALICHLPVLFGMELNVYNVIFTLFAGLLAIILLDKPLPVWQKLSGLAIVLTFASVIPIDYGLYGVLTVVMFHYVQQLWLLATYITLNLVFFIIGDIPELQLFCLAVLPLIWLQHRMPQISVNRTLYWLFYPVHLVILYGISLLL